MSKPICPQKIESLTSQQDRMLAEYREEWLAIGRSTAPADRPTAERSISALYAAIGRPSPRFWWCDGAAVGSLARTVLGANLWDNLGANLRANLWDNLRANLRANLWDNLRANLRANLGANLWANLGWHFWGQHESYWPAYYYWPHITLRKMYTAEDERKLSWWLDVCKSCGWWEPFDGVVFICERPRKQAVDARGRLHCDDGPALLCRDGWPVYAIHGVRVPADVIEQPMTIEKIERAENAEIRRVMIERYGFDSYLCDGGAVLVQHDDFGRLYRKQVGDEPAMQFVRVVNSTAEPDGTFKEYVLPVANTVKTAHEAVATSFGLSVESYSPSFES